MIERARRPGQPVGPAALTMSANHAARELLPCPPPFALQAVASHGVSRSVARRLFRRKHWQSCCNEGVVALNKLYAGPCRSPAPPVDAPSAAQRAALSQIATHYQRVGGPPPDLPTAAGAFAELCGCRPGYADAALADSGVHAPYSEGLVSLPPAGASPPTPRRSCGART